MILRIVPIPALLLLAACGGGAAEADDAVIAPEAREVAAPVEDVSEAIMEPGVDPEVGEALPESHPPVAVAAPAAPAAAPAATPVAAVVTPPAAFAQCSACHSVEAGKAGIGPSLAGVFGANAAHMAAYDYSDAMEGADIVWTEENLHAFLADPKAVVPGTKMALGLKDEAKRQAVIDYLKTL